jgi:hypothetical protein
METITRVSLLAGRMTRYKAQAKLPAGLKEEIDRVAQELAGDGDPHLFRSQAVRELLVEGVLAWRQKSQTG